MRQIVIIFFYVFKISLLCTLAESELEKLLALDEKQKLAWLQDRRNELTENPQRPENYEDYYRFGHSLIFRDSVEATLLQDIINYNLYLESGVNELFEWLPFRYPWIQGAGASPQSDLTCSPSGIALAELVRKEPKIKTKIVQEIGSMEDLGTRRILAQVLINTTDKNSLSELSKTIPDFDELYQLLPVEAWSKEWHKKNGDIKPEWPPTWPDNMVSTDIPESDISKYSDGNSPLTTKPNTITFKEKLKRNTESKKSEFLLLTILLIVVVITVLIFLVYSVYKSD